MEATVEDEPQVRLRLRLLGGFRAERADAAIAPADWRRRSALTLMKLLALEPSHGLQREHVQDVLWPELPAETAAVNLRQVLYAARRALGGGDAQASCGLLVAGDVIALDAESVWIDIDHFRSLATQALARGGTMESLQAALTVYGGELLPEDRYEEWAVGAREALEQLRCELLERLADRLEGEGRYREAVTPLHELLTKDPLREELHRRLMELYARSGNRRAAIQQYDICRQTLARELGVEPDPETQETHRRILTFTGDGMHYRGEPSGVHGEQPGAVKDAAPLPPLPAALRHLLTGPFVGREEALNLLTRALLEPPAATDAPELRVPSGRQTSELILVSGEPGVGKTRLVAEAAREAHRRCTAVLWGASYEHEGASPYGPVVDVLEGYVAASEPAARATLAATYPELTRLLPSLAECRAEIARIGMESSAEWRRQHLFAVVARLLAELSGGRPLLVVLDDLQSADRGTLHLLHHLVRTFDAVGDVGGSGRGRLLIVATWRDEDTPPNRGLEALLATLVRTQRCRRIRLLRLSRPESDRLVATELAHVAGDIRPSEPLLSHVYRLSLGNPLYVVELVRSLVAGEAITRHGEEWTLTADAAMVKVPQGVRDMVVERVGMLDEEARRLVELAAVAGMEAPAHLLRAAAARLYRFHEINIVEALDRILAMHILEDRDDGVAFRHPLWREALYRGLSSTRRALLHGALAEALEAALPPSGRAPVDVLAFHYSRSLDANKAIHYLELAGDEAAAVYANELAESHYRDLVRRLEARGSDSDRARVYTKLAGALERLARYDEALELVERALAIYARDVDSPDRMDEYLRAVAQSGSLCFARGDADAAIARLEAGLGDARDAAPSSGLARVYLALATVLFAAHRSEEAADSAGRAVEIATCVGDERTVLAAETRRGSSLLLTVDRLVEGREALLRVLPLAERLGDLETQGRILNNLGSEAAMRGDFIQATHYLERAIAIYDRAGLVTSTVRSLTYMGDLKTVLGDWPAAHIAFRRAFELASSLPESSFSAQMWTYLGALYLDEGKTEDAVRALDTGLTIAERTGQEVMVATAKRLLAKSELWLGQPQAALDRLGPGVASMTVLPERSWSHVVAWAHLELGNAGQAGRIVDHYLPQYVAGSHGGMVMELLLVRGRIEIRCGEWQRAEATLQELIERARAAPFPLMEGRALEQLGMVHSACGERGAGRQRLEEALAIFRRLGARRDVERAERTLAHTALPSDAGVREGDAPPDITDDQWERIAPLLPPSRQSGRRRADDRATINGIRWVLGRDAHWSDLPSRYGSPSTVHRRHTEWSRSGLWEQIEAALK